MFSSSSSSSNSSSRSRSCKCDVFAGVGVYRQQKHRGSIDAAMRASFIFFSFGALLFICRYVRECSKPSGCRERVAAAARNTATTPYSRFGAWCYCGGYCMHEFKRSKRAPLYLLHRTTPRRRSPPTRTQTLNPKP